MITPISPGEKSGSFDSIEDLEEEISSSSKSSNCDNHSDDSVQREIKEQELFDEKFLGIKGIDGQASRLMAMANLATMRQNGNA